MNAAATSCPSSALGAVASTPVLAAGGKNDEPFLRRPQPTEFARRVQPTNCRPSDGLIDG
jgi:hypothetical protein